MKIGEEDYHGHYYWETEYRGKISAHGILGVKVGGS